MSNTQNIADVKVRGASKKQFRVNGDPNNIIELNTSDIGIVKRLEDSLPQLEALGKEALDAKAKEATENAEAVPALLATLSDYDKKMKSIVNFIFDSNVADKCAAGGTMYDPVDGEFRYMVIVADLMNVYTDDLASEIDKVIKAAEKHTDKYTK